MPYQDKKKLREHTNTSAKREAIAHWLEKERRFNLLQPWPWP